MVRNYLTVAIRNLIRHRLYSLINVFSLSIGITCVILIVLLVQDEVGYDTHHVNAKQIYRIIRETQLSGGGSTFHEGASGLLGPTIQDELPDVDSVARVWRRQGHVRYEDRSFTHTVCLADPSVLDVFTFPLIRGDRNALRDRPGSMLITESLAQKFFPDADPIGMILTFEEKYFGGDYIVAGVLEDLPSRTNIRFDALISTPPDVSHTNYHWKIWKHRHTWFPVATYLLLREDASVPDLVDRLNEMMTRHMGSEVRDQNSYHLQPLRRVHLYSKADYGITWHGDIQNLYTLGLIALFILLNACINFTNLATARGFGRAREVGLRKVMGGQRSQLIRQFLGEAILLAVLAFVLSLTLVELVLPEFNAFTNKQLVFNFGLATEGLLFLGLFVITLLVGALSGLYPAVFLSSYQPVAVLKGTRVRGKRTSMLRRGLVLVQFATTVVFITGTLIVNDQLAFIRGKDLGYNAEHIIVLPIFWADRSLSSTREFSDDALTQRFRSVKQMFLRHPNVLSVSAVSRLAGGRNLRPDVVRPEGHEGEDWRMTILPIDEGFFKTFEVELVAGRNFSAGFPSDLKEAFILNETAVAQLGWDEPIGKAFEWDGTHVAKGYVIGVVRDFHHLSLHHGIEPLALCIWQRKIAALALRIRPGTFEDTRSFLEAEWTQLVPDRPFEYFLYDEMLENAYRIEQDFGRIFDLASVLAIAVSCLGLFGLSSFMVHQRTKEVAIRKVLGAGTPGIVWLLSKEFAQLICVASLIAFPVIYYMMSEWLSTFTYRIGLGPIVFLIGAFVSLGIALFTVASQTIRTARTDPAEVLRNE